MGELLHGNVLLDGGEGAEQAAEAIGLLSEPDGREAGSGALQMYSIASTGKRGRTNACKVARHSDSVFQTSPRRRLLQMKMENELQFRNA